MNETQIKTLKTSHIDFWLDQIISGGVLVFLALLPFHLVIKQIVPEPAGTYWKEVLLALLVLLWLGRCALSRRLWLSGATLDLPVMMYLGIILLRLLLDGGGPEALWGAYISILYLPLFWLVPLVLRRHPRLVNGLLAGLTAAGGLIALGAVLEFVLDKALWPSVELISRQGFPDMYVYGTHLRRVYFVFDSPATLANTLAMILPLALVLVFQKRPVWVRVLSGAVSGLIFTAILLTFSRGIWVALAITAGGILLLKMISDHQWVFLWRAAGVGLAAGILLAVIWLTTPVSNQEVNPYSVEMLPDAYQKVSLGVHQVSLRQMTPAEGEPEKQEWTLFDAIQQKDDQREVIYTHPKTDAPAQVIYTVNVPENAILRVAITLSPQVWTPEKGDGVNFKIYIQEKDAEQGQFVFIRYINPKSNPSDRRWRNYVVNLSAWSGKEVNLYLIAEAGPAGDYSYDWAGWADLDLGTAPEGYVAANWPASQNPVAAHLASITNWTSDESNRDRLAAWNQSLAAWRQNPFWGRGLGSTGVAALRTQPESAFVTESQVLKSLVELGVPGFIIWGFLWFSLGRLAWQVFRASTTQEEKMLALGLMGSLLITFIDGLVYQNLEVKQVNAIFWTMAGLLAFLQSCSGESRKA